MDYHTIVGVDPSSGEKGHGVAIYNPSGKLIDLRMMTTPYLISEFANYGCLFSVEHVSKNKFIYSRNEQSSKRAHGSVGVAVGMCQVAQIELCRWLDFYQIDYVLHAPQCGNWADKKEYFQRITGWTGKSNKDTRSAAYFGYLEAKKLQKRGPIEINFGDEKK